MKRLQLSDERGIALVLTLGILLAAVEVAGVSILAISVYALALLTSVTALQRVLHVRAALRAEGV